MALLQYPKVKFILYIVLSTLLLSSCATPPPKNPENICEIFREHRDWYFAAKDAKDRWGVPIHVPMSIMYQESSFRHDAQPPRDYLFGFIPWGRVSSAYGYSQAKTIIFVKQATLAQIAMILMMLSTLWDGLFLKHKKLMVFLNGMHITNT